MTLKIPADIKERKKAIKDTHRCPYCDTDLMRVEGAASPMGGWGSEFLFLCVNDECPYYVNSVEALTEQGIRGGAYRLAWEPERDWCGPIAASNAFAPRTGHG